MACPNGKYKGQPKDVVLNDINYCQWVLEDLPSKSKLYMHIVEKPERNIVLRRIGYSNTPMKKQDEIVFSEDEPDD